MSHREMEREPMNHALTVLIAGAALATVAPAQENNTENNATTEQTQPTADKKCCKNCCDKKGEGEEHHAGKHGCCQ